MKFYTACTDPMGRWGVVAHEGEWDGDLDAPNVLETIHCTSQEDAYWTLVHLVLSDNGLSPGAKHG